MVGMVKLVLLGTVRVQGTVQVWYLSVQVLFLYGVGQYSTGSRQYVFGMVIVRKGQIRSGRGRGRFDTVRVL